MKKFMLAACVSMMSLFGFAAQAQSERPLWACSFDFKGHAQGVQILFGAFITEAEGTLRCTDTIGGAYVQPVLISIKTKPLALNIAFGSFDFVGGSGKITFLAKSPEVMLGDYLVTQGRAAFIVGAGTFTAVRVNTPALSFDVALEVMKGAGIQAGINMMNISALAPMQAVTPDFVK